MFTRILEPIFGVFLFLSHSFPTSGKKVGTKKRWQKRFWMLQTFNTSGFSSFWFSNFPSEYYDRGAKLESKILLPFNLFRNPSTSTYIPDKETDSFLFCMKSFQCRRSPNTKSAPATSLHSNTGIHGWPFACHRVTLVRPGGWRRGAQGSLACLAPTWVVVAKGQTCKWSREIPVPSSPPFFWIN